MTVRGGGGPQGPKGIREVAPAKPRATGTAQKAAEVKPTSAPPSDAFEAKPTTPILLAPASADRSDDSLLSQLPERASGLRNMAPLLSQTEARLGEELRALRAKLAQRLGDAPSNEAVAAAAEDLAPLQARMRKARRRLASIRRRLRTGFVPAGRATEPRFFERLGPALEQVRERPPGLERAALALELAALATTQGPGGAQADMLRVPVGDVGERDRLGSYLARVAPGAAAARHAIELLGGGRATGRLEGVQDLHEISIREPAGTRADLAAFYEAQQGAVE